MWTQYLWNTKNIYYELFVFEALNMIKFTFENLTIHKAFSLINLLLHIILDESEIKGKGEFL
jgi:hypothetical protein